MEEDGSKHNLGKYQHCQKETSITGDVSCIDKQTLIEYANTLSSGIEIYPDGIYRVFMEMFEQDVELKTDKDLREFVKAYQELMKFVD